MNNETKTAPRFGGIRAGMAVMLVLVAGLMALPWVVAGEDPRDRAAAQIERIDREMPGNLGVYLKWLHDGYEVRHEADRRWYLASTIKIPLAVAVLEQVEAGKLSLEQELVLAESDYVDGAGELLWAEPGTRFTVAELVRNSIEDSDSTSTDMLLRLLGEEAFNGQVERIVGAGEFDRITTILGVRYGAYAHIHARSSELSNMEIMDVQTAGSYPQRYARLIEKLGIAAEEATADTIPEAFDRYYASGENSGTLRGMGTLLERLVRGELLNESHTSHLLKFMMNVTTGERRIKAGLPAGVPFAHKTGTQVNRACNVGVLDPEDLARAIVVVACAESYGELAAAERAFTSLGRLLAELAPRR
jgi:beta-lactamase class A